MAALVSLLYTSTWSCTDSDRSSDIVYAVSYSLLLLNTDLHVVDTTTRMSRSQFVRNTLAAVHAQSSIDEATPGLLFGANSPTESPSGSTSVFGGEEGLRSNKSLDRVREGAVSARRAGKSPMDPTSSLANFNSVSPRRPKTAGSVQDSPVRILAQRSASMATIGNGKNWDVELESVLKVCLLLLRSRPRTDCLLGWQEMYNAIKAQPVFQPSSPSPTGRDSRMSMTLSPGSSPYGTWSGGAINRSASRKSTASTMSSSSAAFKRASVRGFGSFLGASSAEFARSTSPTPSTSTSFSDVSTSRSLPPMATHDVVRRRIKATAPRRIITSPRSDSPTVSRTPSFASNRRTT
jgi:PH/SEC7 domain-containing protein